MIQRSAAILGIAAIGVTAMGLLAPRADADPQQWRTVAPGVECTWLLCRNDNNQTYRVDWVATCIDPGTSVPTTTIPARTWVGAHEEVSLTATCPSEQAQGSWAQDPPSLMPDGTYAYPAPRWVPGDFTPGSVTAAQYTRAVPDGSRPPAPPVGSPQQLFSGSAG